MKILSILIYATLLLYANISFTHEKKGSLISDEYRTGSLRNLIIHKDPIPVPEIKLLTLNNIPKIINLGQNTVTIVNFWATWCAPCREEMPSLNELSQSIDSNAFSIIVIAAGRNSSDSISDFFAEHQLVNLKSYKDPKGKVSSSMNILGLPTSIIVDQHSNELARLIGGTDWNSEEAINFVKKVLEHHDEIK